MPVIAAFSDGITHGPKVEGGSKADAPQVNLLLLLDGDHGRVYPIMWQSDSDC